MTAVMTFPPSWNRAWTLGQALHCESGPVPEYVLPTLRQAFLRWQANSETAVLVRFGARATERKLSQEIRSLRRGAQVVHLLDLGSGVLDLPEAMEEVRAFLDQLGTGNPS